MASSRAFSAAASSVTSHAPSSSSLGSHMIRARNSLALPRLAAKVAMRAPPSSSPACSRLFSTSRMVQRPNKQDGDDDNPFNRPAPPPLPPKEQREFEELVRKKANSLQFNNVQAQSDDEVMHPQYRPKPKADFDGDTNPKTGEVGGPKKDPLTWEKEWSYGGRATDF